VSSFALWGFLPELRAGSTQFSDVTFHLSILRQLHEAVQHGASVFDFWYDASPFGYALFRTYQHLPHLLMYAVYRLCGEALPLEMVLIGSSMLMAAVLPWSFFRGARVFGVPFWGAVAVGTLCLGLAEDGGYGLGMRNFTWGTYGIVMQLWAAVFVVPGCAYAYRFIEEGRGVLMFGLCTFFAVGAHILSAYVLGGTLVLSSLFLVISSGKPAALVCWRGVKLLAMFSLVTAHQWVFIVFDRALIHRSVFEPEWKFSSHGIDWVLSRLFTGNLFDDGRLPVVTVLALLGVSLGVSRWGQRQASGRHGAAGFLACAFLVWTSLFCGYEVWGWLFRDIPLLGTMHLHRFVVVTQIFGVLLAGMVLGLAVSWVPSSLLKAGLVGLVAAFPLLGTKDAFEQAHRYISGVASAKERDSDTNALLEILRERPRGWLYTGMERSWAKELRVGGVVPLYHLTVADGLPTLGMLFHSMSITGDVLFEIDPMRESHYRLFGIRTVVAPLRWRAPPFLKERTVIGRYRVLEYEKAALLSVERLSFQGYGPSRETVRYFQRWVGSELPERHMFGELRDADLRPELRAVSFAAPTFDPQGEARSEPPGVVIHEGAWGGQGITGRISASEESVVVFRTAYHPLWRVTVNGVVQEAIAVTPGFVAVKVPKGEHEVQFAYRPGPLKAVLFVLCAGALIVPLLLALLWRGRRKGLQSAQPSLGSGGQP
jgi:hypothetical protein